MATHSLWLVPDRSGPVFTRLRGLIGTLAARFDTPAFDPHVTLLGGLAQPLSELIPAAESLAQTIAPYQILLGDIVSNGIYFQRLIALVSPTSAVARAHAQAKAALEPEAAAYLPHLSLAYGDLNAPQTEALAAAAEAAGVRGTHFTASRLELWRTDGAVAEWDQAAAITLGAAEGR